LDLVTALLFDFVARAWTWRPLAEWPLFVLNSAPEDDADVDDVLDSSAIAF